MKKILSLFLLIFLLLPQGIFSKVIFKDDFSDPLQSNTKWVILSEDDTPLRFTNGKAELINNSQVYSAFAFHRLETSLSSFTYSANIISDILGSGLFYCTKKVNGRYCGYELLINEKEIIVYTVDSTGNEEILLTKKCDFLKNGNNKVTISGNKNRLLFFCNDYFQFSFKNTMGELQEIGIISPPLSTLLFDDIIVEDQVLDSTCFKTFNSDFYDSSFTGWMFGGSGNYTKEGRKLNVITEKNQNLYALILFPLSKFSITSILQFNDSSNLAGICLVEKIENSTMDIIYYRVHVDENFAVYMISKEKKDLLTGISYLNEDSMFLGDIIKNYDSKLRMLDTLKVEKSDNKINFILNDTILKEVENIPSIFVGCGIFVEDRTNLSIIDFAISNLAPCEEETYIRNNNIYYYYNKIASSPLPSPTFLNVFFDLSGRKINPYYYKKSFSIFVTNNKRKASLLRR